MSSPNQLTLCSPPVLIISPSHHAHTVVIGDKLFLAPLKDDIQVRAEAQFTYLVVTLRSALTLVALQKVVDIATGTGSWAM